MTKQQNISQNTAIFRSRGDYSWEF